MKKATEKCDYVNLLTVQIIVRQACEDCREEKPFNGDGGVATEMYGDFPQCKLTK